MADPFYPPPPRPGSNAIGSFAIGLSPIGTINLLVWQDTIISQYANSPILITLIEQFAEYLNQAENFDSFFDMMWNILSAQGYGLDCWGRIVNIKRTLPVPNTITLGFTEAGDDDEVGFNQEPFYGGIPATDNYTLSDDAYRALILAKAAFNICDGSIPAINQLLMTLFPGRGNAYVQNGNGENQTFFGFQEAGPFETVGFNQEQFYGGQDFGLMTMVYIFDFELTAVERAIVLSSGVLPTPAGVAAIVSINP